MNRRLPLFHLLCSLSLAAMLTACGGGGGIIAAAPVATPFAFTQLSNSDDEKKGDSKNQSGFTSEGSVSRQGPSDYASAGGALKRFILQNRHVPIDSESAAGLRARPNERLILDAPSSVYKATRDTNAEAAWRMGWTGHGVGIGHLDDFTEKGITLNVLNDKTTHGGATALIAKQVAPQAVLATGQLSFGCALPRGLQERQIRDGFDYFERNGFHIVNNSYGTSRYQTDDCGGQAGLIEASIWEDLIIAETADPTTRKMLLPIDEDGTYHDDMLFVFAAGNSGRHCSGGVEDCNLLGGAMKAMRTASGDESDASIGGRVLFVGALDSGNPRHEAAGRFRLADYSLTAGGLPNDYIVAHADIFQTGIGSGTSYAAPRVTGAAALVRHKFPNLNGPQLKQVLVKSATDMCHIGITNNVATTVNCDDGPDHIYGAGKLNILGALSPIDGLTK